MAGGTGSSSPYRRLQLRAKQRGIPANQKAAVLAALLDGPNPGPRAVRTTKTPTPTLRADEDAGGHAPPEPGMRRRGRGRAVKPPPPPPGWGGPQHPAAVDTPTAPSSAARNVARLAMAYVAMTVVGTAMMCSPLLQRKMLYMRGVQNPFQRFNMLTIDGMAIEHFELEVDGQNLRGWHFPVPGWPGEDGRRGRDTVLYLHGNSGSRASQHRLELYRLLVAELKMGVVAIDYRGFGDSADVSPTETTLVDDAMAAWNWTVEHAGPQQRVHVWGHSLGTGVATALLHRLEADGIRPASLVLESPFLNLFQAMLAFPLSMLCCRWPGAADVIEPYFLDRFPSDERVGTLETKTIILHGTADPLVPHAQGRELAAIAQTRSGFAGTAAFESFEGAGHNYLVREPELAKRLRRFWDMM